MQGFSRALMAGVALVLMAGAPVAAQEPGAPESWDGLVAVIAPGLDAAFLYPGADFRSFTKVRLDEPEVAFRPNWLRDARRSRSAASRVTDADAARILKTVTASTIDIFTRAFTDAGFEVVTRDAPDVLRVRIGIVDLVVNAPDTMAAGRTRTFTTNAGEATLIVEARESVTHALLARIADRRETRTMFGQANRVTNTADFRALAATWAQIATARLSRLREISPVPDPLTPGQRLP